MPNTITVWGPRGKRITQGRFVRAAHVIFKKLPIHKRSVDIFLLPGRDMVHLKQRSFPHLPKHTKPGMHARSTSVDVLSFPAPKDFPDPERRHASLGEVYVNYDMWSRNAQHGIMLLAHGMLHLLGYDHVRDRDTVRMERLERKLWDHIVRSG